MYQLFLRKFRAWVSALLGDLRAVIAISATKVDYGSFIEQSVSHRLRFIIRFTHVSPIKNVRDCSDPGNIV
ncbi:hypothetical protein V8E55_001184 [Tylopilus felleus]